MTTFRGALLALLLAAAGEAGAQGYIPEPLTSAREYYEPLMADPTEPSYGGRLLYPPGGNRYGEVTIGDYVGLTRWKIFGVDTQLNIGGGAISRFNLSTRRNNLEVVDFSAGMPVDFHVAKGRTVRVAYWHVSSHLGDDYIQRIRPTLIKRAFDSVKTTLSWSPNEYARLYAGGSYAFNTVNLRGRGAVQVGFEALSRPFVKPSIRAFLAQDFQSFERVRWQPSYNIRGGLRWSDHKRIAAASLFLEYFTGRLYYLQFQEQHESHWGFGLRFEIGNPVRWP
ncbi:MAG: DUF1207 domain-containing protein [Elusimicrobia bacterium]|nr:DUF1207 domain-containing protein [Elusimicrobiota bacterium]